MSMHRPRRSDYRTRRPRVERLEDRRVLATFVVDSVLDTGAGSLREAIESANLDSEPDEIVFDSALFSTPQTIELNSQLPTITQPLSITGPGAELLTLDAGRRSRHLTVASSDQVSISDITFTGGISRSSSTLGGTGGSLRNFGFLQINRSVISGNTSEVSGGAIYNYGSLTINESTISGNSTRSAADGYGGGIDNRNVLTISNSTISGNSADIGGGIFNRRSGRMAVFNSTLSGNEADITATDIRNSGNLRLYQSTIVNYSDMQSINNGGGTANISGNIFSSPDILRGDLSGSYNLFALEQPENGLTNNIVGAAMLTPLGSNAGPSQTHALLPNSPAIDAGDPAFNPIAFDPPLLLDQRGEPFSRVENGRVDLGAVEFVPLSEPPLQLVVSTTASEFDNDFSAGELSLSEAVALANATPALNRITFSPLFDTPQTIFLLNQLNITEPLEIVGPGANLLTLDANGDSRHFEVNNFAPTTIEVSLYGLKLTRGSTASAGFASSGGAIFNSESLAITNSLLTENFAYDNGGGVYNTGMLTIADTTLSGNSAGIDGGGIFNRNDVTITSSTLSENSAVQDGGGIFNDRNLMITSGTLSGNSARIGGGIYNNANATVTMYGSIVANSLSGDDLDGGGSVSGSFNLIEDGLNLGGLTNTITGDPLLGPLQDNGGPTLTHALLPGSPAIDAGDPSPDLTGESVAIPGQRLFNTGLNGAGELLGDREDDPHYEIISKPNGVSRRDATVSDAGPLPLGWAANDADSRWIGPDTFNATGPPGEYVYRTTFDLSDLDVSNLRFEITGSWQADDNGTDIRINGVSTGQSVFLFDGLTDFSVDSGFVAGLNTLDFVVANGPGSTGLRVDDLQLTASLPPADQRGLPRVANGRIDIGAFEVQPVNPTPGDYNGDLVVNAADFTAWRDTLGATGLTPLSGADGDGNGAVTANDYQVWRDNFGQQFTLPAVSLAAAANTVDPTGGRPGGAAASPPAGDAEPVAGGSVFAYAVAELDPGPRTSEPAARPSRRASSLLVEEDTLLLLAGLRGDPPGDHEGGRTDAARDDAFSIEEEESDDALAIVVGGL